MPDTIRITDDGAVRVLTLCRPDEYNTITSQLRDDLAAAIDAADRDRGVSVILLNADGPAFCAGHRLDTATRAQATEHEGRARTWDSVADYYMISQFTNAFSKLWYCSKPTVAAVQGWCIGGGTDMVLWADFIIAGEGASFGYPPSRVWGVPTNTMWVHRLGLERAKRYVLTGDELPAPKAARLGLILECVPDAELQEHASAFAQRLARVPLSQLQLLKMLCNANAEQMGLPQGRFLGNLFDGIARHTQEGLDFVSRAREAGFRQAVRERDEPFGDYGAGPRSKRQRPGTSNAPR